MIKLENVSKYYHNEGVVTLGLRKINLELQLGEFIAITGDSGSGKSTLLNVISGIDTYEDGEVYINNQETSHYDDKDWENYRKNEVAFIFQNYNLIDSYSVLKNVEVALVIQGLSRKERRRRALEILEKVDLTSHLKQKATKLSGGQKQRLAIARALAKDTKIIVADEPTGNLDSDSGKQVLKLLNNLSKDHLVIIVTHNYEQAKQYVTRVVRLFDGEIVEDKEIKEKNEVTSLPKESHHLTSLKKISAISSYNLVSQPKKSIFLMIVTLATVLFVIFIYGTTSSLQIESNYNEMNNYPERIIVKRKDNNPLSNEDFQKLSNLKAIESINKFDTIVDLKIEVYNLGIIERDSNYNLTGYISFNPTIEEEKIIGRMPEAPNEILISTFLSSKDLDNIDKVLNQKIKFSMSSKFSNQLKDINRNYVVVGFYPVDDERIRYVFSDDGIKEIFLNVNNTKYNFEGITTDDKNIPFLFDCIFLDNTLKDNQIIFPYYFQYKQENQFKNILFNNSPVEVIEETPTEERNNDIFVNENIYNQLIESTEYYQYTLNLKDENKAKDVMEYLYENGYYSFSPYLSQKASDPLETVFAQTIMVYSILFSSFVIYLISYLTIKTIMASSTRDFSIMRTMGMENSLIKNLIRFEIISCFIFSFMIFLILFGIFKNNIEVFKELKFIDIVINFFIDILIAVFVSQKYIKLLTKKSLFANLRN